VRSIPESAVRHGFFADSEGVHDSRTTMLAELRRLLDACGPDATPARYRSVAVDQNVLGKRNEASRQNTFRRLHDS